MAFYGRLSGIRRGQIRSLTRTVSWRASCPLVAASPRLPSVCLASSSVFKGAGSLAGARSHWRIWDTMA